MNTLKAIPDKHGWSNFTYSFGLHNHKLYNIHVAHMLAIIIATNKDIVGIIMLKVRHKTSAWSQS